VAAEADFNALIELVRAVRNARTESNVEPGRWIAAEIVAGPRADAFTSASRELSWLARIAVDQLTIQDSEPAPVAGGAISVLSGEELAILPLAGMVDLAAERDRLRREITEAVAEKERAEKQLGNEAFVAKAPPAVVEVQRKRRETALDQIALLERRLNELGA
jgi:valyl-tRNA synthetase